MKATRSIRPPLHLRLVIRQQHNGAFRVEGDQSVEIGARHSSGRGAEAAIRGYCREHGCTAGVKIYFPPRNLWREDWIGTDGSIRSVYGGASRTGTK